MISELKNLEDTIEEINKIEESETQIMIEFIKRKLNAIGKEEMIKISVVEEDLRIETVRRRMKEKPVSFEKKNRKIARKKIVSETEIKAEIIIKTEELKLEILREIIDKKSREMNTERKFEKKE